MTQLEKISLNIIKFGLGTCSVVTSPVFDDVIVDCLSGSWHCLYFGSFSFKKDLVKTFCTNWPPASGQNSKLKMDFITGVEKQRLLPLSAF